MTKLQTAYREALEADKAMSAELSKVYGRNAEEARYDERTTATAELKQLTEVFLEKADALRQAFDETNTANDTRRRQAANARRMDAPIKRADSAATAYMVAHARRMNR